MHAFVVPSLLFTHRPWVIVKILISLFALDISRSSHSLPPSLLHSLSSSLRQCLYPCRTLGQLSIGARCRRTPPRRRLVPLGTPTLDHHHRDRSHRTPHTPYCTAVQPRRRAMDHGAVVRRVYVSYTWIQVFSNNIERRRQRVLIANVYATHSEQNTILKITRSPTDKHFLILQKKSR